MPPPPFKKLIAIFFFVFLLFPVFVLAPSVFWTSNSDWSGGTFANVTNITGDLMLNNTIMNGTTTIYSWFYNNWTYRKSIIINGSTSLLNDYQIMINLTNRTASSDNFDFSRANSQGNDTRFTWLNTSSGLEQNISFWIENWTSSGSLGNATIWIKVPNVTASTVANTTLYMYYGNSSATSASNGTNTFPIFNAGNTLTGWNYVGASIVSGKIRIAGGTSTNYIASQAPVQRSSVLEYTASVPGGNDFLGLTTVNSTVITSTTPGIFFHTSTNGNKYVVFSTAGTLIGSNDANEHGIKIVWGDTITETEVYQDNVKLSKPASGFPSETTLYAYFGNQVEVTGTEINVYNIRVRKYASPEPSVLSVDAEQTAASKGTYLSNITTTSITITSITPLWNATNSTNVNFTVEISANAGSSWCGNIANNTAYTSCGGIGSGTQLQYRINFSTNDTSRSAVVSDITMNYVNTNTTLTCDAGGPYLANSTVMITGNISDGVSALASQPVTVQIKNNTAVLNSTVVTSDASGNYFAKLFVNTTNASSVFVNSTYLSVSGNCTYSLSIQSQTITAANATCTTNSTACSFKNYPISGWVMDSVTGSLINSGTVTVTVRDTGDSYQSAFSGGYFSVTPQFCLSPGKAYGLTIAVDGNGRRGFIFTNTVGKG